MTTSLRRKLMESEVVVGIGLGKIYLRKLYLKEHLRINRDLSELVRTRGKENGWRGKQMCNTGIISKDHFSCKC